MNARLSPELPSVAAPSLTLDDVAELDATFASASAEALLSWAIPHWGERLVVASSFGAEDVVLIDLAVRVDPRVRVFTLDTGRLHPETYEVMEAVQSRYGLRLEVLSPDAERVSAFVAERGINAFYRSVEDRRGCCGIRKVEPLNRVLATADAWVTGLRRDQTVTRHTLPRLEVDFAHRGMVKINPLATWSEADVWSYIERHALPTNRLHAQGYPSIGCAPCTRPVEPGEDVRAGRWWWEKPEEKECGLHR
jgi:phosphoadenosine phosphosulfate reductase